MLSWCREEYSRIDAAQPGDNCATAMKSVVADPGRYDWEGDTPLNRPLRRPSSTRCTSAGSRAIPSSGVAETKRGTYAGLIEKIPYLQDLGITAVELLPVFQFDEQDAPPGTAITGDTRPCRSSPLTLPTVHARTRSAPLDEFRDMVKALHRAGIEVILDVVFNHTAEGTTRPTLCFRGWQNDAYYILQNDPATTRTTPAAEIR